MNRPVINAMGCGCDTIPQPVSVPGPYRNTNWNNLNSSMQPSFAQPLSAQPSSAQPHSSQGYVPQSQITQPRMGCIESYTLGMGYVPWQQWGETYEPSVGYSRGTIFPCLDFEFMRGGCEYGRQ